MPYYFSLEAGPLFIWREIMERPMKKEKRNVMEFQLDLIYILLEDPNFRTSLILKKILTFSS
jgi:hypothetical protein